MEGGPGQTQSCSKKVGAGNTHYYAGKLSYRQHPVIKREERRYGGEELKSSLDILM